MEEQNIQQPTNETFKSEPQKSKKWTLIVLLSLICIGVFAGYYYLFTELQTSNNQRDVAVAELNEANKKLAEYEAKASQARDAQRKADLALFVQATNQYAEDNNGTFPTTEPTLSDAEFYQPYVVAKNTNYNDPKTGKPYNYVVVATVQTPPELQIGDIQYQWPGKCSASKDFEDTELETFAASRVLLEDGTIYCLDS